ncbi:hypothetical protein EGO55_15760 [Caenibius tardaugens NBRC 16725]|nr:hypothetical protein EGO55_15760 [Caenibius tardaugens NBRC 16725]
MQSDTTGLHRCHSHSSSPACGARIQKGRDPEVTPFPFSEWIRRSLGCLLGSSSSVGCRTSSSLGRVSSSTSSSSSVSSRSSSCISSSVGCSCSSVGCGCSSVSSRVSSSFCISQSRVSGFGCSFFGLFRASREGQCTSSSSGSENDLAHVIAILEQRVEYVRHYSYRT